MRYSFVFSALTAASLVTASYLDDYSAFSRRDNQDVDAYIQARNYDDVEFNLMPRTRIAAAGGGGKSAKASGEGGGGGAKSVKEGKASEGGTKGAGKEGKADKAPGGKEGLRSASKEGKEMKSSEKLSRVKSHSSARTSSKRERSPRSKSSVMDKLRRLSPSGRTRSHSSKAEGKSGGNSPFKSREEASRYLTRAGSPKHGTRGSEKATQGKSAAGSKQGRKGGSMKAGMGGDDGDRSFAELHRRYSRPLPDAYVIIRKRSGKGDAANTKAGKQESPPKVRSLLTEAMQSRKPRLDHSKAQTPVHGMQKNTKSPDRGHFPLSASPPASPPVSPRSASPGMVRLQPISPRLGSPQPISTYSTSAHSIEEGPSTSLGMSIPLVPTLVTKSPSQPNFSRVRQVRMEMASPRRTTKPPMYPKQATTGRVPIPENQVPAGATSVFQKPQAMIGNEPTTHFREPPIHFREPPIYARPTLQNTPTSPNSVAEGWVMDKWLKQSVAHDGQAPPSP